MDLHLSPASAAIAMIERLQHELEVLFDVLLASKDHVRVDAMFGIGFRPDDAVRDEPIEVRVLEGDEAVDAAFEALTSIWVKIGQHPRETLRAPGVIALPKLAIEKIVQTNAIRTEIIGLVGSIKRITDRRLVWKKFKGDGKGIVSKQVLRLTTVLTDPLNINFYWDDTGSSGARRVAGDLLKEWEEMLDQNHDQRPTMDSAPEGSVERTLLYAISQLSKINPMEQVAIRRPVQPHIRARVRDGDAKVKPVICPVPFVYDIHACRVPPKIKSLPSYAPNASSRKATGLALLEDEPCIESMNLYQYKEGHRVYGPLKKTSDAPRSASQE